MNGFSVCSGGGRAYQSHVPAIQNPTAKMPAKMTPFYFYCARPFNQSNNFILTMYVLRETFTRKREWTLYAVKATLRYIRPSDFGSTLFPVYLQWAAISAFAWVRGRWWQIANIVLPYCNGPKGYLNHVVIGSSCCCHSPGDADNAPRRTSQATPAISTIMDVETWNYFCIHYMWIVHRVFEEFALGRLQKKFYWNLDFSVVFCRFLHASSSDLAAFISETDQRAGICSTSFERENAGEYFYVMILAPHAHSKSRIFNPGARTSATCVTDARG